MKDRVSFQTQLIVVLAQQLLGVALGVLLSQDQRFALQLFRRDLFRSGKGVAQLAVLAAAKVTGQALDQDSDRAMAEQFLSEAGERK